MFSCMTIQTPSRLLQVCNNLVLGVSMAAVAEGLALGSKLGLDPKLLSDIFNSSSARCWSSDSYNPCPVSVICPGTSEGYPGLRLFCPAWPCVLLGECFSVSCNTCVLAKRFTA